MKKQIVLIHGGDPQESYEAYLEFLKNYPIKFEKHGLRTPDWQENLNQQLGKDYEVVRPEMPNKRLAKYIEWKIWFEKFIPFLEPEIILIGGSLGAIFLAKYLAENDFPKKIKALFLLSGPFEDTPPEVKLYDFSLPKNLENLEKQPEKIFLYHSKDDNVVPFKDLNKYKQALPKATVRVFENLGHLNIKELPELLEDIRKI